MRNRIYRSPNAPSSASRCIGTNEHGEDLAAIIGRKVDFCSRLHPLILGRVKDELFPVFERA
jgi:hypothetical protein